MRRSNFIRQLAVGAFATALSIGFAGTTKAATLDELLLSQGIPALVFASDENAESLVNNVGAANIIDVGDAIKGVISIDQLKVNASQQFALRNDVGNSEWGGIFQILVTGKQSLGVDPMSGIEQFAFEFGVDPTFATQFGGVGSNTMVVMWEDRGTGNHFDVHDALLQAGETPGADTADAEASVRDGLFYWALGLERASNRWIGFGADNVLLPLNASDRLGESIFALDRTAHTFAAGGLGAAHDLLDRTNPAGTGEFIGTSQIGGKANGSPWDLSSETDVEFTIIPAPSALMGGLVLLGGVMLRRRRALL